MKPEIVSYEESFSEEDAKRLGACKEDALDIEDIDDVEEIKEA